MDDDAKQRSDLASVQVVLSALCGKIARQRRRIEIPTDDGDACVLISRTELQSLEHALEIYASTEDGMRLHERVAELCEHASEIERPAVVT